MSSKGSVLLAVAAAFIVAAACLAAAAPPADGAPEHHGRIAIVQDDIRTGSDPFDLVVSYERISSEASGRDVIVFVPFGVPGSPEEGLVDAMRGMIDAEFIETDMHGTPGEIAQRHGFTGEVRAASQLHGTDTAFLGKVMDLVGDSDAHLRDRISALIDFREASSDTAAATASGDGRRGGEEGSGEQVCAAEEGGPSDRGDGAEFFAEDSLGVSSQFEAQVAMNGLGADGASGSGI